MLYMLKSIAKIVPSNRLMGNFVRLVDYIEGIIANNVNCFLLVGKRLRYKKNKLLGLHFSTDDLFDVKVECSRTRSIDSVQQIFQ